MLKESTNARQVGVCTQSHSLKTKTLLRIIHLIVLSSYPLKNALTYPYNILYIYWIEEYYSKFQPHTTIKARAVTDFVTKYTKCESTHYKEYLPTRLVGSKYGVII